MSKFKQFKNRYFPHRRLWRDWRYCMARMLAFIEIKKGFPVQQQEIIELSKEYRRDFRFEREKLLILHAQKLYPNWYYVQERLEWHARPIFHPDPSKSKVVPRKIVYQARDPRYIPKPETLSSLCIVTGMSSNAPYFELGFPLIESIKATRFYKDIPIKILDCGLTEKDQEALCAYFDVEIKDPGWDVNPEYLVQDSGYHKFPQNGWKGCTARPYINRHFPGYDYYMWMDADSWVKDEMGLDKLVHLAESNGVGCYSEDLAIVNHPWRELFIISDMENYAQKSMIYNGLFCCSSSLLIKYGDLADKNIQALGRYVWGFDMIVFTALVYMNVNPSNFLWHDAEITDLVLSLESDRKFQPYFDRNVPGLIWENIEKRETMRFYWDRMNPQEPYYRVLPSS